MKLKEQITFLRIIYESPLRFIFYVSFSYIFTLKLWRKFVNIVAILAAFFIFLF